jgi:hypothetical protein
MDNILFHPSSLGNIMGVPKLKSEKLTDTAKKHCIDVFIRHKYKRFQHIESKYTRKGNLVEEESIALYNSLRGTNHKKNLVTFQNELLIGTPDILDEKVKDAKSSYSLFTFLSSKTSKLNPDYYWQLQGYMMLTGRTKAELFYALVNSTADDISEAKRMLKWKHKIQDNETLGFVKECIMAERNAIYDIDLFKYENPYFEFHSDLNKWEYDILPKDRLHVIEIDASEESFMMIQNKVEDCREWIQNNLAS